MHDTTCVLNRNSVGGVDFKFYLWAQPSTSSFRTISRQQKLCVRHSIACVHNKAIITMEICNRKLPTYQNIHERIGCCKGQVQFSYYFTHFDTGHHDSPFHICLRLVFLCRQKMHSHSLTLMPALHCFCEIGTWYAFGNHTGHGGRTKSPFCRACKTHVLLFRVDLKTVHNFFLSHFTGLCRPTKSAA